MPTTQKLQDFTQQVRRDILRMVHKVNSGHPGGSLGCAEFITCLLYGYYLDYIIFHFYYSCNCEEELWLLILLFSFLNIEGIFSVE